jgi:hypothetical protein
VIGHPIPKAPTITDEPYILAFLRAAVRAHTPAAREVGLNMHATLCEAAYETYQKDAVECTDVEMAHLLRMLADLWLRDCGEDSSVHAACVEMAESLRDNARNLEAKAAGGWIPTAWNSIRLDNSAGRTRPLPKSARRLAARLHDLGVNADVVAYDGGLYLRSPYVDELGLTKAS